jgi:hypothetical protein
MYIGRNTKEPVTIYIQWETCVKCASCPTYDPHDEVKVVDGQWVTGVDDVMCRISTGHDMT